MNQEKFDPHNPEYKKVEDLPQEQQEKFVNIPEEEGGGFVRKEARNPILEAKIKALVKEDPTALEYKLNTLHEEALQIIDDREKLFFSIKNGGSLTLENASEVLRTDREVVLESVKIYGNDLRFASPELRADKNIVLTAIENGTDGETSPLQFASPELRADREIVLKAVKKNPRAIEYASPELRADHEIVLEILSSGGYVRWDIRNIPSKQLFNDRDFILKVLKKSSSGNILEIASSEILNDRDFLLEVVEKYPHALEFVPYELRTDLTFLLEVAKKKPEALAYAPANIRMKLGIN